MWQTVFRLEWKILRRDPAVLMTIGVFTLFLVIAALAGGRHADGIATGLQTSQAKETQRIETLNQALVRLSKDNAPAQSKDPRDPVWMGKTGAARLLVLPPAPLAAVAVGQRDLQPQAVRVNTDVHLSEEKETETAMSGPTRLMTGAFDLAFLFVVLFPLVIIALSYEILSGERERGTLAMLLSQPVSQTALVLGKAAARALALCGVTTVFVVVGLMMAGVDPAADGAVRSMLLMLGVVIAWALFWFAASVLVNAFSQSSATNALVLVGAWLVLVVVVPGLVQVSADVLHPPPSGVHQLHEAREAAQEAEAKLMGMTGTHEKKAKPKDFAARVVAVQEELARRSSPVEEAAHEKLIERQALMETLRFLSPAMVLQWALEDIAGSGTARHRQFDGQADAFHDEYRTHFFSLIKKNAPVTPENLSGLKRFEFEEEPGRAVMMRSALAIGVLLLLAGILVLVALPRFKKIGRLANQ